MAREDEGGGHPRSPWGYAGMGLDLVAPVALGLYVGHRLDQHWDSGPWCLVAGAALGMVVGFYSFLKRTWPRQR